MSSRRIVIPLIAVTIISGSSLLASAQQPRPPQQPGDDDRQQMQPRMSQPPGDPLGDAMFPPDLIMQNQRKLALTDDQKTYIQNEMDHAGTRFNQLQWQLNDAMEALRETVKASPVNEQQALAQLSKVLDAEREIKTLQMGMQIRIKNKLTPEQQTMLQTIRNTELRPGGRERRDRGPGDGAGRPPRPPDGGMRPGGPPPGGPGGPGGGGGGPRPGGGRPGGPGF